MLADQKTCIALKWRGCKRDPLTIQEAATHNLGHFVPAHLANMLDALATLRMRGPATDDLVAGAARFSVSGSGRFDISHHATMLGAFAELTPPRAEAHPEVGPCRRPCFGPATDNAQGIPARTGLQLVSACIHVFRR